MAAPTHAYGLGISPASTHLVGGHGAYHSVISVANPGTQPVMITMSTVGLTPSGPKCTIPTAAPSWLHIGGARTFTLLAHQSHAVPIVADTTSSTVSSGAVVASATPAKNVPHAARISMSVGSRVTVGTTASCHARPVTLPAPSHGGSFPTGLVILPVLLILIITALTVMRRRRAARRQA